MQKLDGSAVSKEWLQEIAKEIKSIDDSIRLDIILVGNNFASTKYVNMKQKKTGEVGINGKIHRFDEQATTEDLLSLIERLNNDSHVTGFMVQLPLPKHIDKHKVLNSIGMLKDVDGLTASSLGQLWQYRDVLAPATPVGIMYLLHEYNILLEGKSVTIVGASPIVGNPLAALLIKQGSTVSITHSKTPDLSVYTKKSDIVISAAGVVNLITKDMIKEGAVVVDVGINKHPKTGKLVGDVDYENVAPKTSYITPVPGGVGPMTIAALLANTVKAYKLQHRK